MCGRRQGSYLMVRHCQRQAVDIAVFIISHVFRGVHVARSPRGRTLSRKVLKSDTDNRGLGVGVPVSAADFFPVVSV